MDSVMNFLADNYIWFFVAAGVLLFALIGFIIDSKKKQKSEFKGDYDNIAFSFKSGYFVLVKTIANTSTIMIPTTNNLFFI